MGWLTALLPDRFQAAGNPQDERYWGAESIGTWAGMPVDPDAAMKISAMFRAVDIIAGHLGRLPLKLYRDQGEARGKATVKAHPLYRLLHDQPNEIQTSQEWRAMGTAHLVLRGNFVNEIFPGARGFADQLWPLHPDHLTLVRLPGSRRLRYEYTEPFTLTPRTIPPERILHVRGLSLDGFTGVSVVKYAREALGAWRAMERYGARFFTNAARPAGAFKVSHVLPDAARARLKAEIQAAHAGENVHKTMLLEGGADWVQLGLTAEDAQLLQSKEFQVREIARFTGVPEYKLSVAKTPTYASVEQYNRDLVDDCLAKWAGFWEQAIKRDLLMDEPELFAEFLFDSLLRGNTKERYESYRIATGGRPFMWPSEVRLKENLDPDDELDAMPPQGAAVGDGQPAPVPPGQKDDEEEPDQERRRRPRRERKSRASLIVAEVAERVVRREVKGIRERAAKFASQPAAWEAALADFYAEHETYVTEALQLPPRVARAYVARHHAALHQEGLGALSTWDRTAPVELIAAVWGEEESDAL